MKKFTLVLATLLLFSIPNLSFGQDDIDFSEFDQESVIQLDSQILNVLSQPPLGSQEETVMEARGSFHQAVIRAALAKVRNGEMSRIEMIRLRVAMMSPGFRKHAEELAVVQLVAQGDDVPRDATGAVDRAKIDWDALLDFLEKLIPILVQLIAIFGGVVDTSIQFMPDGMMYANIHIDGQLFMTVFA
jgi:hypothetical protein